MSGPSAIALAIELQCRGNMHDAGTAIKEAVRAHCDGDYELASISLAKAIAHAAEAKKLCGRQTAALPKPPQQVSFL